jgi:serine/threonine-protein kinase
VGKLGVSATARIVAQVAKALRRAHEAGLVHRDLKPGNVFLSRVDDDEVVKVLDFGIAKILGLEVTSSSTRTGMILGSPHYMSPEQVRRSRRVDHRSDLWALGVIAFRCLTGSLPFDSDELGELLVEICTAPIPSPSLFESTLSGDVDRFMARALARDPEERFQSARELSEACAALGGADAPPTPIPPRRTSPDQPTVYARAATAGVRPSITPSTPATATAASIPGATRPRRGWIAAGGALGAVAAIGAALLLRGRAPASPSIAAAAHATTVLAAAPPPPAPLPPPPSVVASAEAPAEPSKSETPAPRVAPSAPRAASPSVARPAQSAKVTPAAKKEPAEKPYDPTREM